MPIDHYVRKLGRLRVQETLKEERSIVVVNFATDQATIRLRRRRYRNSISTSHHDVRDRITSVIDGSDDHGRPCAELRDLTMRRANVVRRVHVRCERRDANGDDRNVVSIRQ